MPIYEYECECGAKFEEFRSMDRRHDITCQCGRTPRIAPSLAVHKIAYPFRVYGHDGVLLSEKQNTGETPYKIPRGDGGFYYDYLRGGKCQQMMDL